jgi:hypothetical protein
MLNVNPENHRLGEIPDIWDQILASPKAPLREIQGGPGEWTGLYKRNFKKSGVYVLRSGDGTIVYVGIAGEGAKPGVPPIEGGLADRLWTHKDPASTVGRRLALSGIAMYRLILKRILTNATGSKAMESPFSILLRINGECHD